MTFRGRARSRGGKYCGGSSGPSLVRTTASFLSAMPSMFTYTRADTVATYRDSSGVLQQATSSQPLFDHLSDGTQKGLRMEPGRQNKIGCYNASPTDWTGMTQFGGAVFSIADDTAALTAVGLHEVGNAHVFKIDNSAGGSDSGVYWGVTTGNTNPHAMSVWARTTTGGAFISTLGGAGAAVFSGASYQRVLSENVTPANSGDSMAIVVPAGSVLYFILPQFEEGVYATGEIVTSGAAATRVEPSLVNSDMTGIGTSAGGIVMEYDDPRPRWSSLVDTLFSMGTAGVTDRIALFKGGTGDLLFRTTKASTEYLNYDFSGDAVVEGITSVGLSYSSTGTGIISINGVNVANSSGLTLPTSFSAGLCVGTFPGGGTPMTGWVRRIDLFSGAPNAATLNARTDVTLETSGNYDADRNMIMFMGQSNSVGLGPGTAPTYTNTGSISLLGNDGVLKTYADPYDSTTDEQFGTAWLSDSAAANSYAGTIIDDLVGYIGGEWCAVPANKGGTGVLYDTANSSVDGWWTQTDLGGNVTALCPTVYCAIQRIKQAKAIGTIRSIVWDQAATDGLYGHDTTEFKDATERLISLLRQYAGNVPVIIVVMQNKPDAGWIDSEYPDNNWADIQQAQRDLVISDSDWVESEPYELQSDELHFTTDGYVNLGHAISGVCTELLTGSPPPTSDEGIVYIPDGNALYTPEGSVLYFPNA